MIPLVVARAAVAALPWRAIGAALLAAGIFAAGWAANGWRKDAKFAELISARAQERRDEAYNQVKAVDQARAEEQRRTAAQTEIANAAIENAKTAQAHARVADAARRELLARVTALVNARNGTDDDPRAVGGGTSAGDSAVLLADVLGRADARAGELAEALDASRIAGLACERSYDALTRGIR